MSWQGGHAKRPVKTLSFFPLHVRQRQHLSPRKNEVVPATREVEEKSEGRNPPRKGRKGDE